MSDRFSPNWSQLKQPLQEVVALLSGDDHLLVQAYKSATGSQSKANSVAEVKSQLHGMSMGVGIPWILFDTISNLVLSLPKPTRKQVVETFIISTKHSHETLRIDADGRWSVVWELNSGPGEENQVSLFWYIPPDQSNVPVIPVVILDYIAASVSLSRDNLILPALALLLVALESALWDELAARSVTRHSDRVTYIPVEWRLKRVGDQRLVFISGGGTDRELREMSTSERVCQIRKVNTNDSVATLEIELAADLTEFLASEQEQTRETYVEKGLSEAVQRARKMGILAAVPSQLDETIIKLRNNLVHLPSGGILDPQVPDPTGGNFTSLEALRSNPELLSGLTPVIVQLINGIYVGS